MLVQFGNAMIAMMLAKFMLNDAPHIAGLLPGLNDVWSRYWRELADFTRQKLGYDIIRDFSWEEEYVRTGIQPRESLEDYEPYESWATITELNAVKRLLSQYYVIARYGLQHELYDKAVMSAYTFTSTRWKRQLKSKVLADLAESDVRELVEDIMATLNTLLKEAERTSARSDKLIFVDAFMHEIHEYGIMITLGWPYLVSSPAAGGVVSALGALSLEENNA